MKTGDIWIGQDNHSWNKAKKNNWAYLIMLESLKQLKYIRVKCQELLNLKS